MLAGLLNSALWRLVLYFCLFTLSFVLQCRREISHIKISLQLADSLCFKEKGLSSFTYLLFKVIKV